MSLGHMFGQFGVSAPTCYGQREDHLRESDVAVPRTITLILNLPADAVEPAIPEKVVFDHEEALTAVPLIRAILNGRLQGEKNKE